MADVETALVLRMEATLSKFEKQMARAKKAGTDTSTALEKRFANSNKKMARSAETSAQAIGKEMDRLRAKYDPLFAASKRYEAELDELNRAHRVGALTGKQYESALERINTEYTRATSGTARMGAGVRRLSTATRGGAGGIQNIAFQVGDFATQVGAGTSASIALGQQLPQLLGGFGALGAILGAVVAIGVPLAASFFRSGEEAKTLNDRLEALQSAVNDYRSAVDDAMIPTADLAVKYGSATAAARDFIGALKEIAHVDTMQTLDADLNSFLGDLEDVAAVTSEQIDGVTEKMSLLDKLMEDPSYAYSSGLANTREQAAELFTRLQSLQDVFPIVENLSDKFDISSAAAERLAVQMKRVDEADTLKDKLAAMQSFIAQLEETLGPYEDMSDAQQKVWDWANKSGKKLAEIIGIADGAAGSIGGAASEAGRLADELGRAVDNAINLAAQSVTDAKRAQIELDYYDDPVGRAGALKAAQVDEKTPEAPPGTPAYEAWRKARGEAVRNAELAERRRQEIIRRRRADAESTISTGRSTGGAGSASKDQPGLFDRTDDQLLQLERQMEMIGKTRSEVARMTAEYKLLDEARKRGLDLDAQQTASGETLRQEIARQADTIGKLTEAKEQAAEKSQQMAQLQDQLKDGFIDAIVEGENLSGVMESLAKSIAKAALQAALFGEGPFAGASGGGGLLGGLVKGIFSANGNAFQGGRVTPFASGGVVSKPTAFPMAGRNVGVMGEAGPEAIMPLTRGRSGKLGVRSEGGTQRIELVVHADQGVTVEQVGKISRDVAVEVTNTGFNDRVANAVAVGKQRRKIV